MFARTTKALFLSHTQKNSLDHFLRGDIKLHRGKTHECMDSNNTGITLMNWSQNIMLNDIQGYSLVCFYDGNISCVGL